MKAFYQKLIAEFAKPEVQALFTGQNLTPVGYIDLYAGQDQNEENFELFTQPAVLVDWDIDYNDPAKATVNIYACYEQLRDTSNISLNRELGMKFLDFVSCIDAVVSKIESETTGKMEIISEGFNKMDSIVDIYLLTYECSFRGRKNTAAKYQDGDYDNLNLRGDLTYDL
ncbi:MAG: hypothetical protein U1C58_06215 [Flavobacteriaceae bacterium]|nr:hypothetical protein [Flavobacteriaceae bacterium]MDZ4147859.1 hypothetical protein [Flavobacteriaceae bacterium]